MTSFRAAVIAAVVIVTAGLAFAACTYSPQPAGSLPYALAGPLVPSSKTMVTAWDVPHDPLVDASLNDDSKLSKEIRRGYKIFTNTPDEAGNFVPGRMACNNCHLNAGQRERALPLVNVAGMFPETNRRAGRLITLNDRIVDCFLRSESATSKLDATGEGQQAAAAAVAPVADVLPTPTSSEVLAVSAYLTWLARGAEVGKNPAWRGKNAIATDALVPVDKLDPKQGEAIFTEKCSTCHGPDGQGVAVGTKRPGPLWGPNSWNDGAGAARVYTLAGIVRYTMPYLDPGSLTDVEAQQVAAFINSKPRPAFPFKHLDYRTETLPPDSVYYPKRTTGN